MTDQELICTFMEPRPTKSIFDITTCGEPSPGKWWHDRHPASAYWYPRHLTLNDLWEVEERLTDEQWRRYLGTLLPERTPLGFAEVQIFAHATPEQKIKALATVLRPIVEDAA